MVDMGRLMRIVIINEYIAAGGAEVIADLQEEILKAEGHEILRLYFNKNKYDATYDKGLKSNQELIRCSKISKTIVNPFFKDRIKGYLTRINPDIIITHNVFSSPLSVYSALEGYKVLHIAHDASMLCPTSEYTYRKGECRICSGRSSPKCFRKCANSPIDGIKLLMKKAMLDRLNPMAKDVIRLVIAPSNYLSTLLSDDGFVSCTINNPIESDCFAEPKVRGNTGRFAYCGGLSVNKGLLLLLDAIDKWESCESGFSVDVYGGGDESLIGMINKSNRAEYKGLVSHSDLLTLLKDYDYIIIPSTWLENYPTMALEAMLCGVVVIGAGIGGIPEIIGDGRGIVFEHGSSMALTEAIEACFRMPDEEYNRIRLRAYDYVKKNNSIDMYKDRMRTAVENVAE